MSGHWRVPSDQQGHPHLATPAERIENRSELFVYPASPARRVHDLTNQAKLVEETHGLIHFKFRFAGLRFTKEKVNQHSFGPEDEPRFLRNECFYKINAQLVAPEDASFVKSSDYLGSSK